MLCLDIDGVLTLETQGWDYKNRTPNKESIRALLDAHYNRGCKIQFYTSRHEVDGEVTAEWIAKYIGIDDYRIQFGKPLADVYIDDRASNDITALEEFGVRTYNFSRTCYRYNDYRLNPEDYEKHPCFFCGDAVISSFLEDCKVCRTPVCPTCGDCVCTITDEAYKLLVFLHKRYCKKLNEYDGNIDLSESDVMLTNETAKIVVNFKQTVDYCAERLWGRSWRKRSR